jgi:hypothetical protein
MHGFDGYDPVALADLDGVEVAHPDTLASTMGRQFGVLSTTVARNRRLPR